MESKALRKNSKIYREPTVTDFGLRQISQQNFSKLVVLPKVALQNIGDVSQVNVKLVQDNGEKFIKLTPVVSKKGAEKS